MFLLILPQRLVPNRCGDGFEAADVAIGCQLTHTHLDGRDCGQECEN